MTWRKKWYKVAEEFGNYGKTKLSSAGLCYAYAKIEYENLLESSIYSRMDAFNPDCRGDYWLDFSAESAKIRVLQACFFMAMTEKEFDEICSSQC